MAFIRVTDLSGKSFRINAIDGKVRCRKMNIVNFEVHGHIEYLDVASNLLKEAFVPKCVKVFMGQNNKIKSVKFEGAPNRVLLQNNDIEQIEIPNGSEIVNLMLNPLMFVHVPRSVAKINVMMCDWLRCVMLDRMSEIERSNIMLTTSVACQAEAIDIISRKYTQKKNPDTLATICAKYIINNKLKLDLRQINGDVMDVLNSVYVNACCEQCEMVSESVSLRPIHFDLVDQNDLNTQGVYRLCMLCNSCFEPYDTY